ncbi:hypothetical protein F4804DRAFT_332015 [Jackrogersella minutella]|nr:hypothetical protein F4804DRAFT_332015 [Jackrogersella minutella]
MRTYQLAPFLLALSSCLASPVAETIVPAIGKWAFVNSSSIAHASTVAHPHRTTTTTTTTTSTTITTITRTDHRHRPPHHPPHHHHHHGPPGEEEDADDDATLAARGGDTESGASDGSAPTIPTTEPVTTAADDLPHGQGDGSGLSASAGSVWVSSVEVVLPTGR